MRTSALLKTLPLVAILGGLLYAGAAWLGSPDQPDTAVQLETPGSPTGMPTLPKADSPPKPDSLAAQDIAQAYARSPQDADARFKGQRLRLQGVVDQTEAGQGQTLLITLGASQDHAGLRAVVDMGAQASNLPQPRVGQVVRVACLNQGLLMGEPVLVDCRLQPM